MTFWVNRFIKLINTNNKVINNCSGMLMGMLMGFTITDYKLVMLLLMGRW